MFKISIIFTNGVVGADASFFLRQLFDCATRDGRWEENKDFAAMDLMGRAMPVLDKIEDSWLYESSYGEERKEPDFEFFSKIISKAPRGSLTREWGSELKTLLSNLDEFRDFVLRAAEERFVPFFDAIENGDAETVKTFISNKNYSRVLYPRNVGRKDFGSPIVKTLGVCQSLDGKGPIPRRILQERMQERKKYHTMFFILLETGFALPKNLSKYNAPIDWALDNGDFKQMNKLVELGFPLDADNGMQLVYEWYQNQMDAKKIHYRCQGLYSFEFYQTYVEILKFLVPRLKRSKPYVLHWKRWYHDEKQFDHVFQECMMAAAFADNMDDFKFFMKANITSKVDMLLPFLAVGKHFPNSAISNLPIIAAGKHFNNSTLYLSMILSQYGYGCDPNTTMKSDDGHEPTILTLAVSVGNLENADLLIARGATIDNQTFEGAMKLLESNPDRAVEMFDLLNKSGAGKFTEDQIAKFEQARQQKYESEQAYVHADPSPSNGYPHGAERVADSFHQEQAPAQEMDNSEWIRLDCPYGSGQVFWCNERTGVCTPIGFEKPPHNDWVYQSKNNKK